MNHQHSVYRLRADSQPDSPVAEVLLPDTFRLDRKAVHQLMRFAAVRHPEGGEVRATIATPDFHPGSLVPVGAVVAASKMVIPQAIGTDINCGMRLHVADLSLERFEQGRARLVERLRGDLLLGTRDLPMPISVLHQMFRSGLIGFIDAVRPLDKPAQLGRLGRSDFDQLEAELERVCRLGSEDGDPGCAPSSLLPKERTSIRDSYIGTVGGGNHFVELQVVESVQNSADAFHLGIRPGQIAVMVHSGSRAVGLHIGRYWMDQARARWPQTHPLPESGITPLQGEAASDYLRAMNTAANYASLNRLLLAELVRLRLREVFGGELETPLIYDAPHNLVFEENGLYVHRKGATPAHAEQPVLIPGSMGTPSWLMMGLGNPRFLSSASHGAGRARSRNDMYHAHKRKESLGEACCITLNEERLFQEAPAAYKPIQPVIDVQVEAKVVRPVAKMRPLLTFKA